MANAIIVNTNYGSVCGRQRISCTNFEYFSFQGIPYAKPPIGNLRFKAPEVMDKWTETIDATKAAPFAFSASLPNNDLSSEDCLYLNIFTRELRPTKLQPIIIWIHRGAIIGGSTDENLLGPDFILEKNCILVTIAFRLGPLGFLSIPDRNFNIPGNAGLKDQAAAIRWIKENGQHFGGDPENITLAGYSAGSASVHYHMMSNYSKGLFHKGIALSGCAYNTWAFQPNGGKHEELAQKLGWDGRDGLNGIMKTLMSAEAHDITNEQLITTDVHYQNGGFGIFIPCIEPYDDGNCFLYDGISNLSKNAWGKALPLLIGGACHDGHSYFSTYKTFINMFDDNGYFDNAIPVEMNLPAHCEERRILGEDLKRYYYGNETPTMTTLSKYLKLTNIKTSWHGYMGLIRDRLSNEVAPTFLYRFNYYSAKLDFYKKLAGCVNVNGAIHGDDHLFLFKTTDSGNDNIVVGSTDDKVKSVYTDIVTTFAATGNPNCEQIKDIYWLPIKSNGKPFKCLNIAHVCSYIDLPETEHISFWDSMHRF